MSRIVVVGGSNVDIKARSAAPLIGGSSNPGTVTVTPGGVARNIAQNLGILNVPVSIISVIGRDDIGRIAADAAETAGVDLSMTVRNDQPTGSYVAMLDQAGELISAVSDMRNLGVLSAGVLRSHRAALDAAQFIVVDCNVNADVLEYLALHYSEKLIVEPVSVSKSQKLSALLDKHEIYLATPNQQQLLALTENEDVKAASLELRDRGVHHLVVNLGAEGSFVSSRRIQERLAAVATGGITDVTGAGDAAVAGLVYGLHKGYHLLDAARFGQAAATFVVNSQSSTAVGLSESQLEAMVKEQYE